MNNGDRIYSRAHRGEIEVVAVFAAGVLGRKVRRGGGLHAREVVVTWDQLKAQQLVLPLE